MGGSTSELPRERAGSIDKASKKVSGGGFFGRMKGQVAGALKSQDSVDAAHVVALKPAASCEAAGWLFKQGKSKTDWKRRYFVVVSGVVGYFDEESAAVSCDLKKCKFAGVVKACDRWPPQYNKKPASIPDKIWNEHCGEGFELKVSSSTEDETFSCYADTGAECEMWVAALKLSLIHI